MTVVVGRDQSACAPCRSRDQAELALAATAIGRGTCPISRRYTVKVALGDDVGYARDGIRTVYGRCAIGDQFDTVQRCDREHRNGHCVQESTIEQPAAVQQRKRGDRTEATESEWGPGDDV